MKLYNMETQEWRKGHFKPDERWRATQVYRCDVCGCDSNEFYMWGGNGIYSHPKIVCPGYIVKPDLHDLLLEKVEESLERKHPASYLAELNLEIEEMRREFKDISPNVEGVSLLWQGKYSHFG